MLEVLVALVVVVIGVFAIVTAFTGTKAGSSKHVARPKAPKPAATTAATAAPKPAQKKKDKKAAQRKAEEEEMERLVAADAKSHIGMSTDKQRVLSLEEATEKVTGPTRGGSSGKGREVETNNAKPSGNRSAPQPVLSAKQRLIDQEQGFTVVEKREKRAPQVPQYAENERDIDRDLTTFFRQVDRKGKKDFGGGASSGPKKEAAARPQENGGYVAMQKKISNDPRTVWKSTEQWAATQE